MAKPPESEAVALMRVANRQTRVTMLAVSCAAFTFIAVFGGLAVLVWRINGSVDDIERTLRPHAATLVNATVDMMKDMGDSFHNVHEISDYTADLAQQVAGAHGPVAHGINSSAAIAHKLAEFMQHPTISVSLGG